MHYSTYSTKALKKFSNFHSIKVCAQQLSHTLTPLHQHNIFVVDVYRHCQKTKKNSIGIYFPRFTSKLQIQVLARFFLTLLTSSRTKPMSNCEPKFSYKFNYIKSIFMKAIHLETSAKYINIRLAF